VRLFPLPKILLICLAFISAASGQTVITVLQGNAQLVPANLGLSSKPILLRVTTNGVPVPNVQLTIFSSNGPNFPPLTSLNPVTDANGIASVQLVPGLRTSTPNVISYNFVAGYNGATANFVESSYYVSPQNSPGALFNRLAPDYSQLSPYSAVAGQGSATFLIQAFASDNYSGIPNVGVQIIPVRTNVIPVPGSPVQTGYCREGVGPEHVVLTDGNGFASCTPVFTYPNDSLNPAVDTMTFQLSIGGFNTFGPFYYNILPAPLVLAPPVFPVATAGQSYQYQLSASGGIAPYTFSIANGFVLPAGLTLTPAGLVSGFPTTPNLNHFTVQVTDSKSMTTSLPATLAVSGGPIQVILPATIMVTTGSMIDQFIRITGGVPPYRSLVPINLPVGLTLTSNSLVNDSYELKGVPASGGQPLFIATDALFVTSTSQTLQITVAPPLTLQTAIAAGALNTSYHGQVLASGGQSPYTFALTPGSMLPPGVTLSSTGLFAGTPTAAGFFPIGIQVTDASNQKVSATVNIAVSAGDLTSPAQLLPPVTIGTLYTANLAATGGVPGYTFTLGATPASSTVTLTPEGILKATFPAPGTQIIRYTVTDAVNNSVPSSVSIPVILPVPTATAIVNSASDLPGALSPGEIITIFGTNLGPTMAAFAAFGTNGDVTTKLADVQVMFGDIPAPLLYVSATQINAVVPAFTPSPTANVTVTYKGQISTITQATVKGYAPGIFIINTNNQGVGQAAVINQDGSINGPNHPAPKSSVIAIYATGAGLQTPGLRDGQIASAASTVTTPGLSVTIGNQPAVLNYAGAAPGLVAGAEQINVTVPANIASGPEPISFSVGSAANSSQPNVIIFVQ
jgi:uncharacterized protein (TIGR03437 family)